MNESQKSEQMRDDGVENADSRAHGLNRVQSTVYIGHAHTIITCVLCDICMCTLEGISEFAMPFIRESS